jgi:hypothetical protein
MGSLVFNPQAGSDQCSSELIFLSPITCTDCFRGDAFEYTPARSALSRVQTTPKCSLYLKAQSLARRSSIRGLKVLIEASVLEDYAETDLALGMNAAGVILTVVGQHVVLNPGGGRDESIVVGLDRRDDGRNVELELSLTRSRRQGQENLRLTRLGDREVE